MTSVNDKKTKNNRLTTLKLLLLIIPHLHPALPGCIPHPSPFHLIVPIPHPVSPASWLYPSYPVPSDNLPPSSPFSDYHPPRPSLPLNLTQNPLRTEIIPGAYKREFHAYVYVFPCELRRWFAGFLHCSVQETFPRFYTARRYIVLLMILHIIPEEYSNSLMYLVPLVITFVVYHSWRSTAG